MLQCVVPDVGRTIAVLCFPPSCCLFALVIYVVGGVLHLLSVSRRRMYVHAQTFFCPRTTATVQDALRVAVIVCIVGIMTPLPRDTRTRTRPFDRKHWLAFWDGEETTSMRSFLAFDEEFGLGSLTWGDEKGGTQERMVVVYR